MDFAKNGMIFTIGKLIASVDNGTKTKEHVTPEEVDEIRLTGVRIATELRITLYSELMDQYSVADYLVYLKREKQAYASLHFIAMLFLACDTMPPKEMYKYLNAPRKLKLLAKSILDSLIISLEDELREVQEWM